MARRGGPSRRMQGNPLGSILRELDRRSRSTTRRVGGRAAASPLEGPRGPRGVPGPPGAPGGPRGAATVLVTGEDGRARWKYDEPFTVAPVLTATAVDPDPDGAMTVLAVWEETAAAYAVLRVWRVPVGLPVGEGVRVHVVAMPVPR